MQILADFSFLRLRLLRANQQCVIEAEWLGMAEVLELETALAEAIMLAKQHKLTAWIADDRLIGPIDPVSMTSFMHRFIPSLVSLGMKRFAMVETVDSQNKQLIDAAVEAYLPSLNVEFRRFTNLIDARAWACR